MPGEFLYGCMASTIATMAGIPAIPVVTDVWIFLEYPSIPTNIMVGHSVLEWQELAFAHDQLANWQAATRCPQTDANTMVSFVVYTNRQGKILWMSQVVEAGGTPAPKSIQISLLDGNS